MGTNQRELASERVVAVEHEQFARGPATGRMSAEFPDGRVRTIRVVVTNLGGEDYEIRVAGRVLGFIHRAGHVFVALAGTRVDRAFECGQSLLWALAVVRLVTTSEASQLTIESQIPLAS